MVAFSTHGAMKERGKEVAGPGCYHQDRDQTMTLWGRSETQLPSGYGEKKMMMHIRNRQSFDPTIAAATLVFLTPSVDTS